MSREKLPFTLRVVVKDLPHPFNHEGLEEILMELFVAASENSLSLVKVQYEEIPIFIRLCVAISRKFLKGFLDKLGNLSYHIHK